MRMLQEQPSKKSADIPLPHWTTCWRKNEAMKSYYLKCYYTVSNPWGNDIIWVFFTQSKNGGLLIGEAPSHPPNRWTAWWLHTTKAPIVGAWQPPSWWDRFPGPKKPHGDVWGVSWYSGGGEFCKENGEICSKTCITYIAYLFYMKYTMYHKSQAPKTVQIGLPKLSAEKGVNMCGESFTNPGGWCYVIGVKRRRIQGFPIISHLYIPCRYIFLQKWYICRC